jgi:hypothetical protein
MLFIVLGENAEDIQELMEAVPELNVFNVMNKVGSGMLQTG